MALGTLLQPLSASTIAFVNDPTTNFLVVNIQNNDPLNDQQTGQADGDIVGTLANPAFYRAYNGTDLYFRVRLGAAQVKAGVPAFGGYLSIGIDANRDGAVDLFLGVNKDNYLEFRAPGTGLNISPSTTSIATALAAYKIAQTSSNTLYTQVTATLQGAMKGLAGIDITESTAMGYILATSTQANSLNQDLGGVNNKTYDPTLSWLQLGGMSPPATAYGTEVPEPATWVGMSAGLAALVGWRLRRRLRGAA
jgi:hypothetical protein